jgi:hypothetical protein
MPATDYIGRRFDLLALQGAAPTREALLKQQLFNGNSGQICTGVQKLAQRWVLEFFTIAGSLRFATERGTEFLLAAKSGRLRNEIDVIAEYNFAAVRIQQTLKNEEVPEMEDDERLASDELTGIALDDNLLILNVTLTSQAGSQRKPILPISLLPIVTNV